MVVAVGQHVQGTALPAPQKYGALNVSLDTKVRRVRRSVRHVNLEQSVTRHLDTVMLHVKMGTRHNIATIDVTLIVHLVSSITNTHPVALNASVDGMAIGVGTETKNILPVQKHAVRIVPMACVTSVPASA